MTTGPFSVDIRTVGRMAGVPGAELYWMSNLRDDEWEAQGKVTAVYRRCSR